MTTAFVVLGLAAVGAGWSLHLRVKAAQTAEKKRDRLRSEWASARAAMPAPTEATGAELEAQLARAQQRLAHMRTSLAGRGAAAQQWQAAAKPTTRTAAYFELAAFVERMRNRAREKGVRLRPDEQFGFATHAHEGPDETVAPIVTRQRLIAEFLLTTLIDGQAQQIVSVQRERPVAPGADATAARNDRAGVAADFFELDPAWSARVPGFVDTLAMRVVFVGETDGLRNLLNQLGAGELPLVVRAVEAAPVDAPGAAGPAAASNAPLVARRPTRFTVTVEWVELAPAAPAKT
ncbi:Amuc_1100 family pilus-like protein [Horticoccus luteus]|uniref:Amuc_1100 family pilus-like protein n=1 Tax=Horticoccus luteus TaxID=2862869 RepID=A0A8F9TYS6_9BACT|nr:Amuc_1100 family pilus-like protein [Horticoccus luteus]QYM80012.1 Amuc_1100 family pilus-like protein [Horticoccus luteus]